MTTKITKQGYIISKNHPLIKIIKQELTVEPFMTFNIPNKKNNKFVLYKEEEDNIIIPKYYGIKTLGLPNVFEENDGVPINIIFKGSLRPQQEEIINNIIPYLEINKGGILCLPCASGKTVLALYLISHFKIKTLIIVHKTFLLNQWKERILEFTNSKIGILQQNTVDVKNKDIVIGMLQSIAKDKYDDNIFNEFGMVIFDEAHHAPSQHFSKALPIISCKYTIGLSATPTRPDKLEKVLYWFFGDIMYKTTTKKNNNVLVNIINYNIEHPKFCEIKLYTGDINRPATINKLITIGRRNKLIIDKVEYIIQQNNERKLIILSDRIEHLKLLKNRLESRDTNYTSDFYIGGMKQEALDNASKAQIIFATYAMASEALDIPELNTLFLVTPRKEIEQAAGRILRKVNPNLRPVIYDFVDQLPSFINQGRVRKKFYIQMGFKIIKYDNDEEEYYISHDDNLNNNKSFFIKNT